MVVCTVCKRREAIYYRRYSGDYLCAPCLERAVEKGVRRSLGEAGLLKPKSRILIPIPYSSPLWALALLHILPRVARKHGSELVVAVPESFEELAVPGIYEVATVNINPPSTRDPSECWRYDRRWSLEVASRIGADVILLPLTRTDLNLLMIDSILHGDEQRLSESLPVIPWTNPPIVSAFSRLEGEIVAAYVVHKGLHAPKGCIPDLSYAKEIFYSIARGRPELEYSSYKSINLLIGGVKTKPKCQLCGGYTDSEPYCWACIRHPEPLVGGLTLNPPSSDR